MMEKNTTEPTHDVEHPPAWTVFGVSAEIELMIMAQVGWIMAVVILLLALLVWRAG